MKMITKTSSVPDSSVLSPATSIDIGKNWIKGPLRVAYQGVGGPALLRRWQQDAIRILAYHQFDETSAPLLEQQCRYLRRHYTPVCLSEAAAHLVSRRRPPSRLVVVTVDDGYRDFFTVAHPIFSAYKIPATVFPVSDFVDRKCWLWWDQIAVAFQQTTRQVVDVHIGNGESLRYPLRTTTERQAATTAVVRIALKTANAIRLRLLDEVISALDVSLSNEPPSGSAALSWDEIRILAGKGVEFGSHTKTHPILSRLSDSTEIRTELVVSKQRLEEELGQPVVHFCYPNGGEEDFDARAITILEESGFRTAVTAKLGLNTPGDAMLRLKRIFVESNMPEGLFREWVDGRWRIFRGEHQAGDGL